MTTATKETTEQAKAKLIESLNAIATAAYQESSGSFRDMCIGIEVGMKNADQELGWRITKIVLGFAHKGGKNAFAIEDLEMVKKTPKGWSIEGLWAVLYSMCMPRLTPFAEDPMHIRRITLAYGANPTLEYDREQSLGIPLSLDCKYDAKRVQEAFKVKTAR